MVEIEIRKTKIILDISLLAVLMLDGVVIESIWRAFPMAYPANLAEFPHPGMLITLIKGKGKVFNAGVERRQPHTRPVFRRDDQTAVG